MRPTSNPANRRLLSLMSRCAMMTLISRRLAQLGRLPTALIFLLLTFFICGGCSLGVRLYCDYVHTTIPEHPIYPNGRLIRQELPSDRADPAVAIFVYESQDSAAQVAEFYSREKADCYYLARERGGQTICDGNATPFGTYSVTITHLSVTRYWIVVSWDRCGWSFFDD